MAGWISSKLKVAEDLLQQIDQQAAESFHRQKDLPLAADLSPEIVELEDNQLKKKKKGRDELLAKLQHSNPISNGGSQWKSVPAAVVPTQVSLKLHLDDDDDGDWAELLNAPPSESKKSHRFPPYQISALTVKPSTSGGGGSSSVNARSGTGERETIEGNLSVADVRKSSSSSSSGASDSDAEERERKEEATRTAQGKARALLLIKEHEDTVARLEGEKQSLQKILDKQLQQQAREASELQLYTMETADEAEKEKQRHSSTRMEALARVAELEISTTELARMLASSQWNHQVAANKVSELRQQVDFKELTIEELDRQMSDARRAVLSPVQARESREFGFEKEMQEGEYIFIDQKITQLEMKEKEIRSSIESLRREMTGSTAVEVTLRNRLGHLTDHLLRKQSEVEALSSEKAMLLFRIEARAAAAMTVDDGVFPSSSSSSCIDLESGDWRNTCFGVRQGHLGTLLRGVDSVTVFLQRVVLRGRSTTLRLLFLFYITILHLWVIYILLMSDPNI